MGAIALAGGNLDGLARIEPACSGGSNLRRLREIPHSSFRESTQTALVEHWTGVVTMDDHRVIGREETVFDLPPLVSNRRSSTSLREARVSDQASAEDTSQLAPPEPRICHRLAD